MNTVRYELLEGDDSGIARIMLNRPEVRNAQSVAMTYELNAAFDTAAADDNVKVVILAAEGPHFSAGHDMRDRAVMDGHDTVGTWCGFDLPGGEGQVGQAEREPNPRCHGSTRGHRGRLRPASRGP